MSGDANAPLPEDPSTEVPSTEPADALLALQAEFEAFRAEAQIRQDQLLRAVADAENARRRAQDEVLKTQKFAIESFAEALVPVRDSLEAALAQPEQTVETLREGVEITLRQLCAAFERHKLLQIAPEAGARFDPNQHQAIASVPADQQPANTVVSTLQKGYLIADRVLRPALVTVAAAKS